MSLLSIRNLCYDNVPPWYVLGKKDIFYLGPVNFDVNEGETVSIIGTNNSGKSLLGKLITGAVPKGAGEVLINGVPLDKSNRANSVRMVFSHSAQSLNPGISVGRMLEEPLLLNTKLTPSERFDKIRDTLRLVGLMPDHYYFYKHMLSDGQQQRVALARALILDPKVIVADEPFAALDPSVRSQTVNLLLKLQAELGLAFIFISHNLGIVRHISDRTLVMHNGEVVENAPTQTLFADPQHEASKHLIHAHFAMLKV
jgi:cationic peptide transport system ATP-binding protein